MSGPSVYGYHWGIRSKKHSGHLVDPPWCPSTQGKRRFLRNYLQFCKSKPIPWICTPKVRRQKEKTCAMMLLLTEASNSLALSSFYFFLNSWCSRSRTPDNKAQIHRLQKDGLVYWDRVLQKQMATGASWDCVSQTLNHLGKARHKAHPTVISVHWEQARDPFHNPATWQHLVWMGSS